jgi:hypothetical protein
MAEAVGIDSSIASSPYEVAQSRLAGKVFGASITTILACRHALQNEAPCYLCAAGAAFPFLACASE